MKKILFTIVLLSVLTSCATHKKVMGCPVVEVKCVSPGDNGLSTYYLKGIESSNLKGTIVLIDTNDKYKLGDTFTFAVRNPITNK
jgi:hypothetical protein